MRNNPGRLAELIIDAFEKLADDPTTAGRAASQYPSVESWITAQSRKAAAAGGILYGVPGVHHAGVLVDVPYLVRTMAATTWGVGTRLGRPLDPRLDLANVLALWSHAIADDLLAAAAIAARSASGGSAGTVFARAVATGIIHRAAAAGVSAVVERRHPDAAGLAARVMKQIGPVLGTKIAVKFAVKHLFGHVPLVGAVTAGTINAWIVRTLGHAAVTYYTQKAGGTASRAMPA